jgi:starch phosphorylase
MSVLSAQKLPKRIIGLNELSQNLWWSWHQEARGLFKVLDRPLWKATSHNPVKLLQMIPSYRLVAVAEDAHFTRRYDAVMESFRADILNEATWFQRQYPHMGKHTIAYFSMEFAVHNSLPIYAGGLGVLAGDYCKEASDLGLPLVGIGFMYPQGYFMQRISDDAWQEEIYRQLNFSEAPIAPALTDRRQRMKIKVELDARSVSVAVWQVNVGRVKLYLLDSDLEENSPAEQDRADASEFYHLLEEKVIPLYYERDLNGVPHGWIKVVKQAIRSCAPAFSARRMVKEYTKQAYIPSAQASESSPEMAVGPAASV